MRVEIDTMCRMIRIIASGDKGLRSKDFLDSAESFLEFIDLWLGDGMRDYVISIEGMDSEMVGLLFQRDVSLCGDASGTYVYDYGENDA